MFDKDITIINKYVDNLHKTQYKVSLIKWFWSSSKGISINGVLLQSSDNLTAVILMDELNQDKEFYQEPKEFEKNQKGWTLKEDDYLVKGKVENFTTITKILENYKNLMKITKVSTNDFGSEDMWNFEVTGEWCESRLYGCF